MNRKIYLDGELGEKYGRELSINASSFAEVFKCLDCNYPDFRQYLLECEEKGIGFSMEVAEEPLTDERELLMEYREGDMFISPQPAGARGVVKIIAAIVIAYIIIQTGGSGASLFWTEAGKLTLAGKFAAFTAVNLAMTGLAEMMAPDPGTEDGPNTRENKSYLFQGSGQTIEEGDPVPVVYGKLRVPARLVSFDIRNTKSAFTGGSIGISGFTPQVPPAESTTTSVNQATESAEAAIYADPQSPGQIVRSYPTDTPRPESVFPAADVFPD